MNHRDSPFGSILRVSSGLSLRVSLVRFSNDGGKHYRRVEAHLEYETKSTGAAKVTFAWSNGEDSKIETASRDYPGDAENDAEWQFDVGDKVKIRWVEISAF